RRAGAAGRSSRRQPRRRPGVDRRPPGHARPAHRGRPALSVAFANFARSLARLPWYVVVPALVAGAAALFPVVYLVIRAAEADPASVTRLIFRARTLDLLRNTLALTASVLALCTVLAVPLAWLVVRTAIR